MWLYTIYGFFSVVSARMTDDPKSPIDDRTFMVRARCKKHLENLQKRFAMSLENIPILKNIGTDYPYRMFVKKIDWLQIVGAITREVTFDNFKKAADKEQPNDDYQRVLHDVWLKTKQLETL